MKFNFIQLGALATMSMALVLGCGPSGADDKSGSATATTKTESKASGDAGTATAARKAPSADGNKVGDTIKIGLVASQNGDLAPWGKDCINGAQIAVKEINDKGGIGGKKVELMIGDSASKPEQGKSAAEKLISDGAVALVGEVSSGITAQIEKSAFEKGVPVMAVGATRTDLANEGSNFFRVCYVDDFQGAVMAKFAYEKLGLRKMGVMTDNKQPYSVYLSKVFVDSFKKLGGEVVSEQSYDGAQPQYTGQITEMKGKSPDGVFCSGYFTEVGVIAKQIREAGMSKDQVKLLGGDGWDSAQIVNNGGDAIVGGFLCNHYNNGEDRPEVKDFLKKWAAAYSGSVPGTTMGALGYDATSLVIDGVKRAMDANKGKDITGKLISEALDNTENFKAVSGEINLKGHGGNPAKPALVAELQKDGSQKVAVSYKYEDVMKAK